MEGYEDYTGENQEDEIPEGGYYDHVMTNKKYKDQEALAKGLYDGEKHIKTIETENAKMRDYISKLQPFIPILDEYLQSDEYKKKYGQAKNTDTKSAEFSDAKVKNQEERTKEIVESMLGSKLGEYDAKLTRIEVNNILKAMREDKKNFPYMTKEVEDIMGKALSETNNSFPLNMKGLTWLYKAAVGEHLPSILKNERETITQENYANIRGKTRAFTESDRQGNASGDIDEGEDVRKRISSVKRHVFNS